MILGGKFLIQINIMINFKLINAVIYKAPVIPKSGLRRPGLNPGNCLSALGTVGTAAAIS